MDIEVRRVEYKDVETMRELYREEAGCEIVHTHFSRVSCLTRI